MNAKQRRNCEDLTQITIGKNNRKLVDLSNIVLALIEEESYLLRANHQ